MLRNCLVLIVLLTNHQSVLCNDGQDFYTSVAGLESLLKIEEVLLKDFGDFIASTKLQVASYESEILQITKEHETAANDTDNYLTNPVNAFRLIKRLYTDWGAFEERVRQDVYGTYFLDRLTEHRKTYKFPNEDDVLGSALALVRLQETYQLDVSQVAAGILNGVKYGSDMSWQDCYIMGQQLYNVEDYNQTTKWLKESMNRLNKEKYSKEPISLDYKEGVAESMLQLGDVAAAYQLSSEVLNLDPERVKAWDIKDKALKAMERGVQPIIQPKANSYHYSEEFKVYEKLCRGEEMTSPAQLRPLRCRYFANNVGYRLLAPFKVEEQSLDPMVWTLHDVMAHKKIETLKKMAAPRMVRSTVNNATTKGKGARKSYRISKNAWLSYDTHPYMLEMLRTVHDLTGLNATCSEQLQVANYGLGGHYEPHFDFFTSNIEQLGVDGNRIATSIFYFSDVEQGGATAFPYLNIAVKPQKGNMLFWYNLHRSLDFDYRTKHAGCPVLKGSKWIGNVWTHEGSQTFARPCALKRDDHLSLPFETVRY